MTYRSTHDLVGNQSACALKGANIMVRQGLHDFEAYFANGQGSGSRQVLIGIRVSGLEAEALLAFGKRSLYVNNKYGDSNELKSNNFRSVLTEQNSPPA